MGGFWAQLFGLVPMMCLWLADALVRPRLLRLLSLLGCVVLYRYTYGLNLADVCAAVCGVLVCEAVGGDRAASAAAQLNRFAGAVPRRPRGSARNSQWPARGREPRRGPGG